MQIIESTNCIEQFRFPRSKKKRIRAKWAKRAENFRPSRNALINGHTMICHPEFAKRLREHIRALEADARKLGNITDEVMKNARST